MMGPVVKVFGLRGGKQSGLLISSKVWVQLSSSHLAAGCGMQLGVRRVEAKRSEAAGKKTNSFAASESFYFPAVPPDDPARGALGGV